MNQMKKPNFGGWATKYGVLCTDGRTILADAFKHQDGAKLPLFWRHDDSEPGNVLGHVVLEHQDGVGVRAKAFLNDTERGLHSKTMIEHGDIDQLSIKAVRLRQNGTNVVHGDLVEVSLVPVGANKDARIDAVYIEHGEGMVHEMESQGIIYTGMPLELIHEDASGDQDPAEDAVHEDDSDEFNLKEVYESMNEKQKLALGLLINQALAQEDAAEEDSLNHEGENTMGNVFDKTASKPEGDVLTHEQISTIFSYAEQNKITLKDAVLAHAEPFGILNIESLFPEPKQVTNTPEWIRRNDSWVAGVLGGVHQVPFSRIKSASADITHDEARAKGYIKGDLKAKQFFEIKSRVTTPKTIYKMQQLDRDDIIDIEDFDVVAWIKEEMRWMLQEELARAILFGDGRADDDPYKITETNIRPIAFDEDFYTAKVPVNPASTVKEKIRQITKARRKLKGNSSRPTLYIGGDDLVDMLLEEDGMGRRLYDTEVALAAALGVKEIVEIGFLDDNPPKNDDGDELAWLLVHLGDYDLGASKGGQTSMFEDFDIDYNQYKYLIETRRSGALIRYRSAVAGFSAATLDADTPTAPAKVQDNLYRLPELEGVQYLIDGSKKSGLVKLTKNVVATVVAKDGYTLPTGTFGPWTLTYTA